MLKLTVIFCCILQGICQSDPIISLPNGKIRGLTVQTLRNKVAFYAYMGIPFAAPPTGSLRFQPPQPVNNWPGILDVTSNMVSCWQITTHEVPGTQSEDCLYLNVYTTAQPGENNASLPVIVAFYGGSFTHGAARGNIYAPQHLIESGLIVVTFNYRTGPFGFLSTGDTVIPGNMGLKDQQCVLRWIQRNIYLFGGDPDKVTIEGQSAGAASVTYQILSPSSAGLFRGAVSSSGSVLCSWAFQPNAVGTAYGLATMIDPNFTTRNTSEELLELLLKVDAEDIHNTESKYGEFAPVIEPEHEGAIITEAMYESLRNGNINNVPLFIGMNSEEYLSLAGNLDNWRKTTVKYDNNPAQLVNRDMNIDNSSVALNLGTIIRSIYTDGLFEDNLGAGIQWMSDDNFSRANIKYAQMQANYTDVYFYQFSYHGIMGGNNVSYPGIGKVQHGEDAHYFWATETDLSEYPESDIVTMDRWIKLHANFVKYLDPTYEKEDLLQNISWPKVSSDHFYYLNIDTDLFIEENPRKEVYKKWVNIFEKYAQEPFITY